MFTLTDVPKSGTALDRTAAGQRQTFGSRGAELRGLWVQNFGADTSFVGAMNELIVVQNYLRRKWIVQTEKGVMD